MRKQRIIPAVTIPVAAFVVLLVMFPSLFIPSYKAYEPISVEMSVYGIKEVYGPGEPISFTVYVKSFGYNQPFPNYEIFKDGDTDPVWQRNYMTPIEPSNFPEQQEKEFYFPLEDDEKISFDKSGEYTLRVYIGSKSVEKSFQVSNTPYLVDSPYESSKQIAIEKIKEAVLSDIPYEEKLQIIRQQVQEKNLKPFGAIITQGLKDEYKNGEQVSFNIITFGYRNWCIMPKISLYLENHTRPLYEEWIVHTCPPPLPEYSPRIFIYSTERHLQSFPSCQYLGMHKIVGETFEFGPRVVGQYYCNGEKTV